MKSSKLSRLLQTSKFSRDSYKSKLRTGLSKRPSMLLLDMTMSSNPSSRITKQNTKNSLIFLISPIMPGRILHSLSQTNSGKITIPRWETYIEYLLIYISLTKTRRDWHDRRVQKQKDQENQRSHWYCKKYFEHVLRKKMWALSRQQRIMKALKKSIPRLATSIWYSLLSLRNNKNEEY